MEVICISGERFIYLRVSNERCLMYNLFFNVFQRQLLFRKLRSTAVSSEMEKDKSVSCCSEALSIKEVVHWLQQSCFSRKQV